MFLLPGSRAQRSALRAVSETQHAMTPLQQARGRSNLGVTSFPQGRLTLIAGSPVMGSSVSGGTTIYYAPFVGKYCPILNSSGAVFLYDVTSGPTDNVGLSLALGSNWAANSIYDLFIALNNGVITLATGPDWSQGAVAGSNALGASVRGTGAGSTALQLYNGIQTNANAITLRNSNTTTFNVQVNQATYVGTFRTPSVAGQAYFQFGTNAASGGLAILNVWNAYSQVPVTTTVGDTTASWTYSSATIRAANAGNTIVYFTTGLAVGNITATYNDLVRCPATIGAAGQIGVALNATTTLDIRGQCTGVSTATTTDSYLAPTKSYPPQLGSNYVSANEAADGTNTVTFFGAPAGQMQGLTVTLFM